MLDRWYREGCKSATSLTTAVSGTASSKPITPHNQPQKRMPTVAATGPILTRVAINLGIRKLAETMCKNKTVRMMMTNGSGVLNCRIAPARGRAREKIRPRNGTRFKIPLTIPIGTAPCIPSAKKTRVVVNAMTEPMIRLPATKPRTIWFKLVVKRSVSTLEPKKACIRVDMCSLEESIKKVKNGTTPAMISTFQTDPAPRTR